MMNHSGRHRNVPSLQAIVQHDTNDQLYTLGGIIVNAAGTLKVEDRYGKSFTFTFTEFDPLAAGAYSIFPARLDIEIVKVYDTGTTIADADMIGLRY
jgi:hypothetical protein